MKTKREIYELLKENIIEYYKEDNIPKSKYENYADMHYNKLFKLNIEIELLERIFEVDL